ncbi:MAG TPA: hypothetical protein VFN55_12710 [Solirubrobacteraceae bacterium]|nr:hypothetical protein [Solirubrobacteraceae bacterium]
MARTKHNADLFDALRESGMRKKVAKALTSSAGRARRGKTPSTVESTIQNLRNAAAALEHRVGGGTDRSEAAKKAARTRKRNAAKRSASAKKAAKTRAKGRR